MEIENTTLAKEMTLEEIMGPRRDSLSVVIPITIAYVTIFTTGCLGNISTCVVIAKNKAMHTATNYYLFSLAVSDLVLLISGLPEEIYSIWYRYPYIFGSWFCFGRGLLAETSVNASILTITAFTVERYLAICHPFISQTMSKLSRAIRFILCIWCSSCALAMPQALQFKIKKIASWSEDSVVCGFEPIFIHSLEVSTFVFFVTPMLLITVLYALIGLKLKTSNVVARRNTSVHSRSSKNIVKMLVAVVVTFFICWVPFHVQRLFTKYSTQYVTKENHSIFLTIYVVLTYSSGILYYLSATVNPILYNIMSVKFRNAFKETFSKCCGVSIYQSSSGQRRYSMLSRSVQRRGCLESTTESGAQDDSSTAHTSQSNYVTRGLIASNIETTTFTNTKRNYLSLNLGGNLLSEEFTSKSMVNIPQKSNRNDDVQDLKYISIRIEDHNETKMSKCFQLCHCVKANKLNRCKKIIAYYSSPTLNSKEARKRINDDEDSSCNISNSSLKHVENGALEDELTLYTRELQLRELQGI